MGRGTVYNNIFDEKDWEKVNQENKQLLDDFIEYKKSSNKSAETLKQYYNMIRLFFIWDYKNNGDKVFVNLKKRELIHFFGTAVETWDWSPSRIATVKSSLSSLSNYIENILDDEYPDFRNIITKIETPSKKPVREKTIMTQEQIDDCLFKLCEAKKYQVACYFALACYSGARKSELLRFKTSYFEDSNLILGGCMYKTPEKIKTKGKDGGKMIEKYIFAKQFKPYFDLWMKQRKEEGINTEWLFVTKSSGEWKQAIVSNANFWCESISECLGTTFYSHAARHRFVTMMKENNLPDEVITQLVGWTADNGGASSMVGVYSDVDKDTLLEKYFSADGITQVKQGSITDI